MPSSASETSSLKRPGRLADQIYDRLLRQIVEGVFAVGARLPSEVHLCERFGVSRPVIRETISRLHADALVVTRRGSGSIIVRRPDQAILGLAGAGEMAQLMRCFEFRIGIEGEAAYLAAQRRTDDDMESIEAALADLDDVIAQGAIGVGADINFHASVSRAAKNSLFVEQLERLSAEMRNGMTLTRSLSLARKRKRQLLVQNEHVQIVTAIKDQDDDRAREAMRIHIDNARKRALDDAAEPA